VIADAIVSNFETNGIRCWYAPRDIDTGADWGEAITKAIDACPLFLLIFSGNANASKHVLDELYYSLAEEKVVIPFRVENLDPSGAMRLHLSSLHWLDAYDPTWESHIDRLFETISANLSRDISLEREKFVPQGRSPTSPSKTSVPRILFGVSLVAVITLFIIFGIPWLRDLNDATGENVSQSPPTSPTAAPATPTEAVLTTATPTAEPSPTPIPLGSTGNPIIWMFIPDPSADFDDINTAMEDVVAAFDTWSGGLILKLIPAIDPNSIVEAICDGETSLATMWAFHYLLASEQDCANVEYIWVAYSDINYGGMIVTPAGSDISELSDLAGKTLCIPEYTSTSAWLIPSLEMRAAGIDPDSSQITIVESGDHYSVLEDVLAGACDAGSAFYDARGGSDIVDVEDKLIIIVETASIPNHNISFATTINDETSQILRQFIDHLSSEGGNPEAMALIDGYSTITTHLIPINDYYYDGIKDLLQRAGLSAEEAMLLAE
jgi:phosphate/phosphite/phosphonate ABC transporter binding protein